MLRRKQLLWAVVSLVVIGSPSVWAMDMDMMEGISGEVTADYFGKYIWRGQTLTDGYVFQPGVSLTCPEKKFTLGVWGNMDQSAVNGERDEFTEIDLYLDYTDALPNVEGVSYSVGAIHYSFHPSHPNPAKLAAAPDTYEIYGGLTFEKCPFNPTATLYYDCDMADGFYGSLGISHSVDISELGMGLEDMADSMGEDMLSTVDLSATLGYGSDNYNSYYWESTAVDALNDLVISLAIPVQVCEYATVTASVNYVSLIDGSISNSYTGNDDTVYGGVGVSMPF